MIDKPLVSIALPVYNGEKFLKEAIETLINQTYTHFEIIICDNASTDSTEEICKQFLYDSRVSYYKNKTTVDVCMNFNKSFSLSKGKYFMWAAFDDIWDKTFLEKAVPILESNPDAVACQSNFHFISEDTKNIISHEFIAQLHGDRAIPIRPRTTFYNLMNLESSITFYMLFRSNALRKTRLLLQDTIWESLLMFEILLQGDILLTPEYLFKYRVFITDKEVTGKDRHPKCFTNLAYYLMQIIDNYTSDPRLNKKFKLAALYHLSNKNIFKVNIMKENSLENKSWHKFLNKLYPGYISISKKINKSKREIVNKKRNKVSKKPKNKMQVQKQRKQRK